MLKRLHFVPMVLELASRILRAILLIILAVLAMIHIMGEWVDRRKRQKRTAALKTWIDKQDKPPAVIYRKVQIRLAHQRESD